MFLVKPELSMNYHHLSGIWLFSGVTRTWHRLLIWNCCHRSRGLSPRNKIRRWRQRKDISSDLKNLHSPRHRSTCCLKQSSFTSNIMRH